MPVGANRFIEILRRGRDRSVGLTEPIAKLPCVASPEQIVPQVAIEIADADNLPVGIRMDQEIASVVGEAAIGGCQPIGHLTSVAAPKDVLPTIAIEIAGTDDVPIG